MLRYSRSVNRLSIGAYAGLVSGGVKWRRPASILLSISFPLRDRFFPSRPCLISLTTTLMANGTAAGNRVTAMSPVGVQLTAIYRLAVAECVLQRWEVGEGG